MSVVEKDYYQFLSVARNASNRMIIDAIDYKKAMIAIYHTDPEVMKKEIDALNKAIEVLSNPDSRAEYDLALKNGTQADQKSSFAESTLIPKELKGEHHFPDGGNYIGGIHNRIPNGLGICKWPDGSKYAGEWLNGKRHGIGTYVIPDCSIYVGSFVDDEYSGTGMLKLNIGIIETGKFLSGEYVGVTESIL